MYTDRDIDIDKAIKYYEKAAPLHENVYTNLSSLYLKQIELKPEPDSATEEYISNIHYKLGFLYEFGKGVEKDDENAEKYYLLADKINENIFAYRRLGILYMKQNTDDTIDAAIEIFWDLYSEQPYKNVILYLIQLLIEKNKTNLKSIYPLLIQLCNYGMDTFDVILYINENIEIEPFKSIEITNIDSKKFIKIKTFNEIKQIFIKIIENGKEVFEDIEKNAEYNEESQFKLGVIYENGINQQKDSVKANYWYKKSSQFGYYPAIWNEKLGM